MRKVAIITARGGSKRIPRKNIKLFLGKPIIAYSIEAALKSELFDEVMVSTDDAEIAEIAQEFGAKVPFMRGAENSDDYSGTADVIYEVLSSYNKMGTSFDYACCIYPTAPLISSKDIVKSFRLMQEHSYETVFPIVVYSYPIQRALMINKCGKVEMIRPENMKKRSQELEQSYHDAGQFYWLGVKSFINGRLLFSNNTGPYILDEFKVQDIDNDADWLMAELKYKFLQQI